MNKEKLKKVVPEPVTEKDWSKRGFLLLEEPNEGFRWEVKTMLFEKVEERPNYEPTQVRRASVDKTIISI